MRACTPLLLAVCVCMATAAELAARSAAAASTCSHTGAAPCAVGEADSASTSIEAAIARALQDGGDTRTREGGPDEGGRVLDAAVLRLLESNAGAKPVADDELASVAALPVRLPYSGQQGGGDTSAKRSSLKLEQPMPAGMQRARAQHPLLEALRIGLGEPYAAAKRQLAQMLGLPQAGDAANVGGAPEAGAPEAGALPAAAAGIPTRQRVGSEDKREATSPASYQHVAEGLTALWRGAWLSDADLLASRRRRQGDTSFSAQLRDLLAARTASQRSDRASVALDAATGTSTLDARTAQKGAVRGSADAEPRARKLQASSPSATPCSGRGIFIPAPAGNQTVYSCNGTQVTAGVYTSIEALRVAPASTAAYLTFVAAVAGLPATVPILSLFPNATALLPATLDLAGLPALQAGTLSTLLGVASLSAVTRVADLIQPSLRSTNSSPVFTALGGPRTAIVMNLTQCTTGSAPAANDTGVCACPLDFTGDACQWPRPFRCTLQLADVEHDLCIAANGVGFAPPARAAPSRPSELFMERAPGVGPAQLPSVAQLARTAKYIGVTRARDDGSPALMPPPAAQEDARSGYASHVLGAPSCLFFDTSGARGAALWQLPFRVQCEFATLNATSRMAVSTVLTSPRGAPYTWLLNDTAGHVANIASAAKAPLVLGSPPAGFTCNGSAVDIDARLASDGFTRATAPGAPPYYYLPCVERNFTYAVGGDSHQPWALSQPPSIPLALRVRALSLVRVSDDEGVALVPLPLAALTGRAPVSVHLNMSHLHRSGIHWEAGRLYVEARVVSVLEGVAPSVHTPPAEVDAALSAHPDVPPAVALVRAAGYPHFRIRNSTELLTLLPPDLVAEVEPRLQYSSLARLAVDDVSFREPTGRELHGLALGLSLGLGIPAVLAYFGVKRWYKARQHRQETALREAAVARQMREDAAAAERALMS